MHRIQSHASLIGRALLSSLAMGTLAWGGMLATSTPAMASPVEARGVVYEPSPFGRRFDARSDARFDRRVTRSPYEVYGDRRGYGRYALPAARSLRRRAPDLVGLAERDLARLRIPGRVEIQHVRARPRFEGIIVGQSPQAGSYLDPRGTLIVQVGESHAQVPDVSGMRVRRAVRVLRRAGLEADVRIVTRSDVEPGRVLRMRPQAGRWVDYGTTVRIRVAERVEIDDHHAGHGHGAHDHGAHDHGADHRRGNDRGPRGERARERDGARRRSPTRNVFERIGEWVQTR